MELSSSPGTQTRPEAVRCSRSMLWRHISPLRTLRQQLRLRYLQIWRMGRLSCFLRLDRTCDRHDRSAPRERPSPPTCSLRRYPGKVSGRLRGIICGRCGKGRRERSAWRMRTGRRRLDGLRTTMHAQGTDVPSRRPHRRLFGDVKDPV